MSLNFYLVRIDERVVSLFLDIFVTRETFDGEYSLWGFMKEKHFLIRWLIRFCHIFFCAFLIRKFLFGIFVFQEIIYTDILADRETFVQKGLWYFVLSGRGFQTSDCFPFFFFAFRRPNDLIWHALDSLVTAQQDSNA